jgi:hypothetical protein
MIKKGPSKKKVLKKEIAREKNPKLKRQTFCAVSSSGSKSGMTGTSAGLFDCLAKEEGGGGRVGQRRVVVRSEVQREPSPPLPPPAFSLTGFPLSPSTFKKNKP